LMRIRRVGISYSLEKRTKRYIYLSKVGQPTQRDRHASVVRKRDKMNECKTPYNGIKF